MEEFNKDLLKQLYVPAPSSHKGQNGKVLIIGGSVLFHSGAIWPLEIASKIVDMAYFSSVDENNELVKGKFKNGIVIPRKRLEIYINEADAILIGCGLSRPEGQENGDDDTKELTEDLFKKYPAKKWVVDGGSLQTISPEKLPKNAIVTPHHREFELLKIKSQKSNLPPAKAWHWRAGKSASQKSNLGEQVRIFAQTYNCVVLLKGPVDIVSDGVRTVRIEGGNAGMTKGGTGDVLAGLTVSLYSKNDAFLSACSASYINKKAGESLGERVGLYFNATDLVEEIPVVLNRLI